MSPHLWKSSPNPSSNNLPAWADRIPLSPSALSWATKIKITSFFSALANPTMTAFRDWISNHPKTVTSASTGTVFVISPGKITHSLGLIRKLQLLLKITKGLKDPLWTSLKIRMDQHLPALQNLLYPIRNLYCQKRKTYLTLRVFWMMTSTIHRWLREEGVRPWVEGIRQTTMKVRFSRTDQRISGYRKHRFYPQYQSQSQSSNRFKTMQRRV